MTSAEIQFCQHQHPYIITLHDFLVRPSILLFSSAAKSSNHCNISPKRCLANTASSCDISVLQGPYTVLSADGRCTHCVLLCTPSKSVKKSFESAKRKLNAGNMTPDQYNPAANRRFSVYCRVQCRRRVAQTVLDFATHGLLKGLSCNLWRTSGAALLLADSHSYEFMTREVLLCQLIDDTLDEGIQF